MYSRIFLLIEKHNIVENNTTIPNHAKENKIANFKGFFTKMFFFCNPISIIIITIDNTLKLIQRKGVPTVCILSISVIKISKKEIIFLKYLYNMTA